jgi:hypothetical protein
MTLHQGTVCTTVIITEYISKILNYMRLNRAIVGYATSLSTKQSICLVTAFMSESE